MLNNKCSVNANREQMWITLTEDIPTLKSKLLKLYIL